MGKHKHIAIEKMTCMVYSHQKKRFNNLISKIKDDYGITLSVSEVVREAIDKSLDYLEKNVDWVMDYI